MDTRDDRCTVQSRSHMYTIAIALKERLLREQVPVRYGSSGMPEKLYIYIQIEKAHSKRSLQSPPHPSALVMYTICHYSSPTIDIKPFSSQGRNPAPRHPPLVPSMPSRPPHKPPAPTQLKGHSSLCQFKHAEINHICLFSH